MASPRALEGLGNTLVSSIDTPVAVSVKRSNRPKDTTSAVEKSEVSHPWISTSTVTDVPVIVPVASRSATSDTACPAPQPISSTCSVGARSRCATVQRMRSGMRGAREADDAGWRRGKSLRRDAAAGVMRYARFTLGMGPRQDSYFAGMRGSVRAFYSALLADRALPVDAAQAAEVLEWCEAIAAVSTEALRGPGRVEPLQPRREEPGVRLEAPGEGLRDREARPGDHPDPQGDATARALPGDRGRQRHLAAGGFGDGHHQRDVEPGDDYEVHRAPRIFMLHCNIPGGILRETPNKTIGDIA